MDFKRALQENITQESIAYGYTLSVWGSGAILINAFRITSLEILLFILGGVLGFGVIALTAYNRLFNEIERRNREKMIVGSMIHILASVGTVALSLIIIEFTKASLDPKYIFLLVGVNTTLTYNLLLPIEELIYKDIAILERRSF
jgi:hypothetical protein